MQTSTSPAFRGQPPAPDSSRPKERRPRRWPLPALAALLCLFPSAPVVAAPDCVAEQRLLSDQQSRLAAHATDLEAVLLGEVHTSAADHAWQLRTLQTLAARRPLSLGLEMIPAARQPILARYSAGRLDETSFLKEVGWQEVWGHDPELYLPLLRWARAQGIPLLALNAEPALVRRVRQEGLAAIPPRERQILAPPVAAGPAYRRRLEAAWRGHRGMGATPQPAPPSRPADRRSGAQEGAAASVGSRQGDPPSAPPARQPSGGQVGHGATVGTSQGKPTPITADRQPSGAGSGRRPVPSGAPDTSTPAAATAAPTDLTAAEAADLERFIDSQLLRDRAMAERIAAAQRRDPARLVVALIGQGHLEGGDGVPQQLRALGLTRTATERRPPLSPGCGPMPPRARLGAYLESDASGVWVRQVAPGSAAAAAGIRPGDRILELNGTAVQHAGEVIRGARLQPDGVPLRLTIERAGRRLRLELRLPPRTDLRLAMTGGPAGTMAAGAATGSAPRPSRSPQSTP